MDKELFVKNRKKLLSLMENDSILISFSRRLVDDPITNDKYDVNRNYFYLTGVFEFRNIVMLIKGTKEHEMMFIMPYNELEAKWVGAPYSADQIKEMSGIMDVRYVDDFERILFSYLANFSKVYLDIEPKKMNKALGEDELFAQRLKERFPYVNILNGRKPFETARTVKDPIEIAEMEKAIEITNKGILNILDHLGEAYEYQLESYFDQSIKYNGATGYAFATIAASGKNSCCLHYQDNNCKAKNGDLILFDLGCSLNLYCSDISRTFPISGKFTPRQREIYDIVLKGQKLVFDNAKPGITVRDLNRILVEYYQKELKRIGLIKDGTKEEVFKYYYHSVSHHIGIDCHDLCDYGPLKPGCVISNEPGLYIEEENIGIRIEDDVLITEDGARWLSPQILKDPDEIEKYLEERKK